MADDLVTVTATGPVNIAVVKYWGKRDDQLILPVNSSLSLTLDQEHLRAKTTVAACGTFSRDRVWLNGEEQNIKDSERLQNVLKEIRRRARKRKGDDKKAKGLDIMNWHVHICSENNFPTAAGLASSAAGYACLVYTLAKLYGVDGDISEVARQGSGSACRSIYGGFVSWEMGDKEDGSDSLAVQVADEKHWPDIRILLLVVTDKKKHIGSTAAMKQTVRTSELFQHRIKHTVPDRMRIMNEAIQNKSFEKFAEETMKDSNQMHAVCLDTQPPVSYMTDVSRDIVRVVHAINDFYGQTKLCYTFDAGPNACLFMLDEVVPTVLGVFKWLYEPEGVDGRFVRGMPVTPGAPEQSLLDTIHVAPTKGALQYIISTKVGPGPQVLDNKETLLDTEGLPKHLRQS